jgi:hypothetical protein
VEHDEGLQAGAGRADGADFVRIEGIGRMTAASLRAMGLRTFDDLAAASAEELAARWEGKGRPTAARIRKEGWLEQAARLAEGDALDGVEPGGPTRRRFTVELRIDDSAGTVLATRAAAVDGSAARTWPGWQPQRLVEFLGQGLPDAALPGGNEPGGNEPGENGRRDVTSGEGGESGDKEAGGFRGVHAFAVVAAPEQWPGGSAVTATIRLDAAGLGLRPPQRAVVLVDLCCRSGAGTFPRLLQSHRCELNPDGSTMIELPLGLPEGSPMTVFAALRVLVEQFPGARRAEIPGVELTVIAG